MLDIIARILNREAGGSREIAKERLRLVLVHDRSSSSPELLNALKEDLIKVIRDYLEIDEEALLVNFENESDSVALIANIPVKGFRRVVNE
ncbi:MAG: cell division topological specificity factor MinE [Syntrophomonadaceae bacterium]|nr:cell division topological specificity factor MinE [Syntrophomonadaceae bacterium]